MKAKTSRICIVGAGPSGLASAEALKELGYTNVTVLERSQEAGGMALTEYYRTPDGRDIPYELGSFQPIGFKPLSKYFKKYDVHLGKKNLSKSQNPDKPFYGKIYSLKDHKPVIDFTRYKLGMPLSQALGWMLDNMKLVAILIKYRKLMDPGFALPQNLIDELSVPVGHWVKNNNFKEMKTLLTFMGSTTTFSNPKFRDVVPALIMMKLLYQLIRFPPRYLNGSFKFVREGYQQVWQRAAKQHEVLFAVIIKKITRDSTGVTVEMDDKTLHFDEIILTCAPSQLLNFLDLTPEEKYVYERVHYVPGWRVAFLGKGLPHDGFYAFTEPYLDPEYDQPIIQSFYPEGQVDDETWLYSSVVNYSNEQGLEEVLQRSKKLLNQEFKGEITQWLGMRYWKDYTPHFSTEDLRNGILEKLQALQNKNNTYYLGGTISGTSHQEVAVYAEKMVKKFFG